MGIYTGSNQTASLNATGSFKVTAPAGITIYSIHVVNASSTGMGHDAYGSHGFWGEFYWNGGPGPAGRSGPLNDTAYNAGGCCSQTNLESRTVGWFLACNLSRCTTGAGVALNVGELDLTGEEDTAPTALPMSASGNLWAASGWVRGTWPASVVMSDPTGVCSSAVALSAQVIKPNADQVPNRHAWVQCSQSQLEANFNTATIQASQGIGLGSATLVLLATNAAGLTAHPSKTVQIDNSTPTISLSGPTDAPSTAGIQYVDATAGGSPSGIAAIVCAVDGGPVQSYPGASARVPVNGIGEHNVSCYAQNNAVDPAGQHGQSTTAGWSLKIGQPTLVGIGFQRLVGLDCHTVRARVRHRGRWVTIHRHGRPVWVLRGAGTRIERVTRCHPRTVRRRTVVLVRERRHGRIVSVRRVKVVKVVVPPKTISQTARDVPYGRSTTVSGWLGTSGGVALAGRRVQVMAAPDNHSGQFTAVATTTTAADGTWRTALPAGPSRVVEAVYAGDPNTGAASSGQVHVRVPARIRLLSLSPTRVSWGGTVRITGRLLGGYLPPGGALVRLRIGFGRSYQTYGVTKITGNGRFTVSYTFGLGQASLERTYFFQVATLPQDDYPYAPAVSGRRYVAVGGHPWK